MLLVTVDDLEEAGDIAKQARGLCGYQQMSLTCRNNVIFGFLRRLRRDPFR